MAHQDKRTAIRRKRRGKTNEKDCQGKRKKFPLKIFILPYTNVVLGMANPTKQHIVVESRMNSQKVIWG